MKLTVTNPPIDLWQKSDTAYPALLKYGYDVYAEIGDEDNQSKWIYVIGSHEANAPSGYAYSHTIKADAGFSNTGNTLDGIIASAVPLVNATYEDVENIQIIPENEYSIDNSGEVIGEMKMKKE